VTDLSRDGLARNAASAGGHHHGQNQAARAPEIDPYPPSRQRATLLKLAEALGCRDNAVRRDECGDWCVVGKLGHIYAIPGTLDRPKADGFQIYFRGAPVFEEPLDTKAWTWAKKGLAFCKVTNDGDEEGMLFLDRLPTADEVPIIRDKLGIPKKREISQAEAERLRAMGFSASHVVGDYQAQKSPLGDEPVSSAPNATRRTERADIPLSVGGDP
jgi:hypothetical protein